MTMQSEHMTAIELFEYEVHCNDKVMEVLASLSVDALHRDHGFGLRTVHRTMAHIADVLRGWSTRVGPHLGKPVWQTYDESEDIHVLRARLAAIGQTAFDAARQSRARGVLGRDRRLHHVFHLITHGTHHRAQVLSMLTLLGREHPMEGGDFGGWSSRRR